MKIKYLFPSKYKKIGWVLLVPGILLGLPITLFHWDLEFLRINVFAVLTHEFFGQPAYFQITQNNILDEVLGIATIIGGLLIAFSKERDEDELVAKIRLEALVWAILWNYGVLILAFLFVFELAFFRVMVFNMFTPLILFLIKFNVSLRRFRRSVKHEE